MVHDCKLSRRRFLKRATQTAAAAAAFPYIVPSTVLGRSGAIAANSRIGVGVIGTGGQGRYDMQGFLNSPDAQVLAVCDPKGPMREMAREQVDKHYGKKVCTAYNDFRDLIARTDIDAVLIASTDCWHVLHALAAVRSGKDVYVEKPLALSLEELQTLRDAVHRYGRLFQFGTQQRSLPNFRFACELVRNGRIGELKNIRVSAPCRFTELTNEETYKIEPVPQDFDYEMWLGPAPWAPYTPKRVLSPFWFHTSDYSLGYVAGWGIHHVDIAQWGAGTELTGPVEIEGSGRFPPNDSICDNPVNWDIDMKYANGVTMSFTSDGGKNKHGTLFEGTEGWVYVNRSDFDTYPKSLMKDKIGPNEIHLPASTQHQQNLLDCMRTRTEPVCPIDIAVRSDMICHLSYHAIHLGRPLQWNPDKEEFVNDPAANQRLKRAMRSPWHL